MFFEYPQLLWLMIVPALLGALYLFRELTGRRTSLNVASGKQWQSGGRTPLEVLRHLPELLRLAAMCLIVVCIARPRSSSQSERVDTEGIDIMLAMDVSTSMLARDFEPDRINAAKDIAMEFIAQRPSDRMGIVVFAGESYTQCPLTTDRATLINLMKELQTGLIDDGTAIGNGLATAVARLTDLRVYTIGVGANGSAPYPVMTPWGIEMQNLPVQLDEDLLRNIASITGGRYFRATDNTKLAEIYAEINKMEKTRVTVDNFPVYKELFLKYALWALALLLLELVLRFLFKKLP